jgi:hypothetical protein
MRLALPPNKMTISLFCLKMIPLTNKASKQIDFDSLQIFSNLNRKLSLLGNRCNCKRHMFFEKEIRLLYDTSSNAKDTPFYANKAIEFL